MTDTVSDIVVVGQRRRNDTMDPFPSQPAEANPPIPGDVATIEPIDSFHPCDDPVLREQWNKDAAIAAGAKAIDKAARDAGENGLTHRERAAFVLRNSDGTYEIGPIREGSVFPPPGSNSQPSTFLDPDDIEDKSRIVGIIHNHNVGQHQPSPPSGIYGGDQAALQVISNIMNTYNPGSGDKALMYITAQTSGPNPYNKINVYSPSTIQYDANGNPPQTGPEVNRNGASCPL